MRLAFLSLLVSASLLPACAVEHMVKPQEAATYDAEKLAILDMYSLCNAYHHVRADNLREEILRRGLLKTDAIDAATNKRFAVGMHECAILVAYGHGRCVRTIAIQRPQGLMQAWDCQARHRYFNSLDGLIIDIRE